jgi:ATP-dependent Clp protease ATP-binding subunit ClpA
VFGARPLKRVIQNQIQNPLATELLKGAISSGGSVRVDYADDEFQFEANAEGAPATEIETESVA